MTERITILGAGAFGTAVATLLAHKGHSVMLWCREPEIAQAINEQHKNPVYLSTVQLAPSIKATTSLQEACSYSSYIFETIPVAFLRSVVAQAKPFIRQEHRWVIMSKGIENETFGLPSVIIAHELGYEPLHAVLAGPTFAKELVERKFTAAVLASSSATLVKELMPLVACEYFQPYPSNDPIGVQVSGAIKNVLALAIGVAHGVGCHANTIAYMLTQGMQEIAEIVYFFEGKQESVYGLAGLGDMVLTCTSMLSKNLQAGKMLGEGKTIEEIKQAMLTLPEGLNTLHSLYSFLSRVEVVPPIIGATYKFIYQQDSADNFLRGIVAQAATTFQVSCCEH